MHDLITFVLLLLLPILLWLAVSSARNSRRISLPSDPRSFREALELACSRLKGVRVLIEEFEHNYERTTRNQQRVLAFSVLDQIREEFFRMEVLVNGAVKFLPEVSWRTEARRLLTSVRFRLECERTRLRIIGGGNVTSSLRRLDEKLKYLAAWGDLVAAKLAGPDVIRLSDSGPNK